MNAIAVADQNWAIARETGLLFFLPFNLERFRTLTRGGTVIMDSRTMESFPEGRPPEGRRNIIVSKDADLTLEGMEVAPTPEAALTLAGGAEAENVWVIGGCSVYTSLLSRCGRVYLASMDSRVPDADGFFPNLDKLPGWQLDTSSDLKLDDGVVYRLREYVNTKL